MTYLAYYYHNENPLLASKYLDKVFEIPLNNLYMNNMIQKVVIYLIAKINHQNNRNNEALVKAEELLKKSRYDFYSKLFGLSLMIQIKCKLSQDEKAKSLYDELVMFYEKKKYDNEYYHAYDMLYILARSASALSYHEVALRYALDALDKYSNHLDPNDQEFFEIYLEIAKCYFDCKDCLNTKEYLNKSKTIMNNYYIMDEKSFYVQNSLLKLADCNLDIAKYNLELHKSNDVLENLKEIIINISLHGNSILIKVTEIKDRVHTIIYLEDLKEKLLKTQEIFKKQKLFIEDEN